MGFKLGLALWTRSILEVLVGLAIGLALLEFSLPLFSGFVQRTIRPTYSEEGALSVALLIMCGLLVSIYPTVIAWRTPPVAALRGEVFFGSKHRALRILLFVQLSVSITLSTCSYVAMSQHNFLLGKDLGIVRNGILYAQIMKLQDKGYHKAALRFKTELLRDPSIASVTLSDRFLVDGTSTVEKFEFPEGRIGDVNVIGVDEDYLQTLGITLITGRNFLRGTDIEQGVLINETFRNQLSAEDPVGRTLNGFEHFGLKNPTIRGVVKDFHFESLYERVGPLVLQMNHFDNEPYLLIRIRKENRGHSIEEIRELWRRTLRDGEVDVGFIEERRGQLYTNEEYLYEILSYSALVTVTLSCLGIFGLTALAVTQRSKEISIRKVMGGSTSKLWWLIAGDFAKLVMAGNLAAGLLAYWVMEDWLSRFPYRIELGIETFALIGLITLLITQAACTFQILRMTIENPVSRLRCE